MIVAIRRQEWRDLEPHQRKFGRYLMRRLEFGEPAIWKDPDTNERWRVHADTRIDLDDIARVATFLGRPHLVPDVFDDDETSHKKRRRIRERLVERLEDKLTRDWPTGVKRTVTRNVVTWEPRVVDYEQVSRGMFCIASDDEGECIEWEERFRQVPNFEMKNLRDDDGNIVKDEDGNNVKVPKLFKVTTPTDVDIYFDANDVVKHQPGQVKDFFRAGDIGNLIPVEEDE